MKIIKLILVIIISVYLFISFIFDALHISFKEHSLNYNINLEHAISLESSSIVTASGFNIGRVILIENIKNKSRIKISIDKKYKSLMRKKSKAYVFKRKFIGLTMIEIVPDFNSKILDENSTIEGVASPRYNILEINLENIILKFDKIMRNKKTISFLNELDKLFTNINYIKNKENELIKLKNKVKTIKNKVKFIKNINIKLNIKNLQSIENKINQKYKNLEVLAKKSKKNIKELKNNLKVNIISKKNDVNTIIKNVEDIISKQEKIINQSKKIIDRTKNMGNISLFLGDKEIFDYAKFIIRIIKQEPYRFIDPFTVY